MNKSRNVSNPKVSIIIPSYNSGKTIERTLKSILSQNYTNIEVVVVDGASKDDTLEKVRKYSDHIDKIISEKDNGIYDAINKGLQYVTGELVGMISSNDWLYEGAINKLVEAYLLHQEIDVFHGDIIKIKIINESVYAKVRKGEDPALLGKRMTVRHPSCFVKRSWYKKHQYNTNYKIAGDYEFILRSFLDDAEFFYTEYPFVVMSDGGMSTTFNTTLETFNIQLAYKYYKFAIAFFVKRLCLVMKSKILRFFGKFILPSSVLLNLEIKKWNGELTNSFDNELGY